MKKGEPIIGASVAYTGTNIGTVTDLNGEFILKKRKRQQATDSTVHRLRTGGDSP